MSISYSQLALLQMLYPSEFHANKNNTKKRFIESVLIEKEKTNKFTNFCA